MKCQQWIYLLFTEGVNSDNLMDIDDEKLKRIGLKYQERRRISMGKKDYLRGIPFS